MIRNAVLHLSNEQPLLADLFDVPDAGDVGLLCTNLRMMDGKRPVFIDTIAATFFFPYLHIRFIEIPPASLDKHVAEGGAAPGTAARRTPAAPPAPAGDESRLPVLVGEGAAPAEAEDGIEIEAELEIDEDFLQRVRDI